MSQFNPNMTKEQLVNDFRAVDPSYNRMSDELAYRVIVKKFPQYKLNSENLDYNPNDESGIVDKLGTIWKDGYNRSLQGMVYEITQGKKKYELGNYHPGLVSDIAAGVASFFQPLDFATTVAGGGLGGASTKAVATKYVTKKLIQNGAKPKVASRAARMAVKSNTLAKTVTSSAGGAGALGLYSGAGEALNEYISDGTVTPGKVVKAGAKGAVLGGMTGATNAFLTQKGAGVLSRTLVEVGQFGTVSPLLEGRTPTTEDWVHAGGMILGIKGVNKVAKTGFNELNKFRKEATKPELRYEATPEGLDLKAEATSRAEQLEAQRIQGEVYTDKKGSLKFKVQGESDNNMFIKFFHKDKVEKMPKDIFNSYYRLEENVNISPKKLKNIYFENIRKMEKELEHSRSQRETNRALIEKGGDVVKKRNLKDLNNIELRDLTKKLQFEVDFQKQLKELETKGILHAKPRYSVFLDKILPEPANKLLDIIRPARNQGTVDPIRRVYVAKADQFVVDQRRTLSETYDLMSRAGFTTDKPTKEQIQTLSRAMNIPESQVSKNYFELLSKAVEDGVRTPETIAYRQISDFLINKAKESGVDVSGYLDNYIPRILKQGVAEKIFADIYKLADIVAGEAGRASKKEIRMYSVKDDVIDLIIQSMNNPELFAKERSSEARFLNKIIKASIPNLSKETRDAYESILKERKTLEELSPFKAMALMGRLTYGEVFKMDGNIEKKRTYKLPQRFYERDIRKLLGIYSANVARRSSEVKQFGRKGEIYKSLIDQARVEDVPIMRELHSHVLGSIGYNRRYNLNPGIKDFMQKVMEWETSTKIALGTATAMNLSQFAISSALSAGYWRFAKGAYKYHTDKEFKRQVDASGGNLYKYVNEMMGISQQSDISKKAVGKLTQYSGFNAINSLNNILASASARVLIDDLVAISSGKRGIGLGRMGSKQWANSTLTKMGINPNQIKDGKLPNSSVINAMGKFAIKSQLQKDILSDPLILNRPTFKPFLQFKSFGLRQYNFIMDTLKHDLSHGNFMPMLRLAAGGFATGAIAIKAKELMKQLASGEKAYDPATFFELDAKEIAENIAAIGSFGFLGDFLTAGLEEGRSVTNALAFFVSPPFMSDIGEFHKFLGALENDYKNYQGDFIRRVPSRALRLTGSPLLRDVSKRLETKGLKTSRIKFLRGRRKSALLDRIIKSSTPESYREAIEDMKKWNQSYPMFPILITDIDYKAVVKRKMQKYKKRQNV